jgi:hypothetical protein
MKEYKDAIAEGFMKKNAGREVRQLTTYVDEIH